MDYVSRHHLTRGRRSKDADLWFDVYQQLGIAWEHLGLQCKHWDGFRPGPSRESGRKACRICGKVEGAEDAWLLLPRCGRKAIGRLARPTSKKIFASRARATVVDDTIVFQGAELRVRVNNPYRSSLWKGKSPITVAADRGVQLCEDGLECHVDTHLIRVSFRRGIDKLRRPPFGAFPWELSRAQQKRFPVLLEWDEAGRFTGLTIFKPKRKSRAGSPATGRVGRHCSGRTRGPKE